MTRGPLPTEKATSRSAPISKVFSPFAKMLKSLTPLAFFAVLIIAWELVMRFFNVPSWLIPKPSEIFASFFNYTLFGEQVSLLKHFSVTITEILIGFMLGAGVGFTIGTVIAYSKMAGKAVYPLIKVTNAIPIVIIAPILIRWFGYEIFPKVMVVTIISFFPLAVNTILGLTSVDPALLDLLRSLSASGWKTFYKVRLPSSMPYVFSGLKIAAPVAVVGAVIGEFMGATEGLGRLALLATARIQTANLFVVVIILAVIGISLFGLISILERVIVPWKKEFK